MGGKSKLARVSRGCAIDLLKEAANHRGWTATQRNDFTRAFNSLQRLAGCKIRAGRCAKSASGYKLSTARKSAR